MWLHFKQHTLSSNKFQTKKPTWVPDRERASDRRWSRQTREKEGAAATMASGAVVRAAEMEKMSVEQLKLLKEQTDLEVNLLQDSLNNIRTATSRLDLASNALHDLSLRPQGPSLSLSSSLSYYVFPTKQLSHFMFLTINR